MFTLYDLPNKKKYLSTTPEVPSCIHPSTSGIINILKSIQKLLVLCLFWKASELLNSDGFIKCWQTLKNEYVIQNQNQFQTHSTIKISLPLKLISINNHCWVVPYHIPKWEIICRFKLIIVNFVNMMTQWGYGFKYPHPKEFPLVRSESSILSMKIFWQPCINSLWPVLKKCWWKYFW